jgi:glutaredoxin-like YruB-family protein
MKKVVVYSQPGCPPCDWAKEYLTERGVPFTVRAVRSDYSAQRELVGTYKSRSTPTVVVGDEVMIGFDPDRLEKMLAE